MKHRFIMALVAAVAATSITAAPALAEPAAPSSVAGSSYDDAVGYTVAGVSGLLGAAVAIGIIVASDPRGIEKIANMLGI